jgi:hypothetical protein
VAANEAFARVRHSNKMLDDQLTERDEKARMSLDRAHSLLKGKLRASDSRELDLLGDAFDEIEQRWSVLMLLPNGPYESVLREIVEALEADSGAGRLTTEEQALYEIARSLTDAFKSNSRGSEMSWRRLELGISQASREGGPRIAYNGGRKSIN